MNQITLALPVLSSVGSKEIVIRFDGSLLSWVSSDALKSDMRVSA
jgi:hypothetical protein